MNPSQQAEPFYIREGGLRFTCQAKCAACCKISGRVEVSASDIAGMAAHLDLTVDAFTRAYIKVEKDQALLEERADGPCVLLGDDDRCTVYAARPVQCRTYPFWDEVLANDFTWLLEKDFCPGIDEGRHYMPVQIEMIRKGGGDADGYDENAGGAR